MKKRNKKKKHIFSIIYIALSLLFLLFLKIVNFIPNSYLLIILATIILFTTINIILINKKKKVGYIFSILLIIIYSVLTYYLSITTSFFSSFSKIHYNEETFLVVVLKDSTYKKINDLENKNIGYIENNLSNTDKALSKINKNITKKSYQDYDKLFNDLNNNNIDSILINETYYNIKSEEETIDNYRIIHKIKIRSIVTDNNKEVDISKDSFTIYISGIDTYGNIETVSRSDVNILATINPTTKQVLLTSIPRDSYVTLHNTTGYKDKLTHAGNYGINMSIDTIEDLLNIDINYYLRVNFTTLEKTIDALGGVDVYSEYSFISYIDNYQFYKGYNHMNGKEALAFSRERKSLPGGDIDRGRNQQAVIEALIRKITSKEIIYNYTSLLRELRGNFQTNLSDKDITKLIKQEIQNPGGWNVTSNSITGNGEYNYTYSYQAQKLYVLVLNSESINNAIELINRVLDGELLKGSYNSPENIKNPNKIIKENEVTPSNEEDKNENENNQIKDEDKEKNESDNNQVKDENKEKNEIKENINTSNDKDNDDNKETKETDENNPLEDILPSEDKKDDDDNTEETTP